MKQLWDGLYSEIEDYIMIQDPADINDMINLD